MALQKCLVPLFWSGQMCWEFKLAGCVQLSPGQQLLLKLLLELLLV